MAAAEQDSPRRPSIPVPRTEPRIKIRVDDAESHNYSKSVKIAHSRRDAIREILLASKVSSQEELLVALADRGIQTTQPVLSRDLRAMRVAKRAGTYQVLEGDRTTPLEALRSLLRSTAPAGPHMVVVRCEPGAASAVARALEAEGIPGLLGTVAGDDTVFAAVSNPEVGDRLRAQVTSLL
jgi:transcriptional regulator of arginine metabolism